MDNNFRGKRLDNGKWIYGELNRWSNGSLTTIKPAAYDKGDPPFVGVDPTTVCRFTGKSDRVGQEIYEGDVLFFDVGKSIYTVHYGDYTEAVGILPAPGFFVTNMDGEPQFEMGLSSRLASELYVVGNQVDGTGAEWAQWNL